MKKILCISNLKKDYLTKKNIVNALDNINISVNKEDFITIVGPSGCGKSTLLSIIGNLENKSYGDITFSNNNIKVGYMFQEDALFPWLTVYENCILGLKIKKENNKANLKYVKDLLKKYGLKNFINHHPNELSGGMRQRVALIRTLALKPDILLLDEPFSKLDYQTKITVSDDVYNIIKEEKKTAIMVSHDITDAICLSNKVVILTKRPATIKNIYEIDFKNIKPSEKIKDNKFNYYYNLIWKDLDYNEK